MQNLYLTQPDYWRERDFGAKISAVFEFIGAHWRSFGKCLLYFVLPPALLLGIGVGFLNNSTYNKLGTLLHGSMQAKMAARTASPNVGGNLLMLLGVTLMGLLLVSTVYGYLRARLRLPAAEVATPQLVWAAMRERMGTVVLAGLLFLGLYMGAIFAFLMVGGAFAAMFSSQVVVVVCMLALLVGLAYVGVALSLYFPVLWLEDVTVTGAIGRCFRLVKGSWWATCGLLIISVMIQFVLSILFYLPQYAVLAGKLFQLPFLSSDVLGIITNTLATSGQMLTAPVVLLAAAFQYFNLSEKQEGYGLSQLVSELGQPQLVREAQSHHYRPDEEGEY